MGFRIFDRVIRGPSRFASSVPNRTHSGYAASVVAKLNIIGGHLLYGYKVILMFCVT